MPSYASTYKSGNSASTYMSGSSASTYSSWSSSSTGASSVPEVKTRINHNKQVVCVTNAGQGSSSSSTAGEPKTDYRSASRYYQRG